MATQQILDKLPFYVTHRAVILWSMVGIGVILFLLSCLLFQVIKPEKIRNIFGMTAMISFLAVVFAGVSFVFMSPHSMLTQAQINLISKAPSEIIKTDTIDIVASKTASSDNVNISGSRNYITGSTTNSTGYQYTVKTGNNTYQVKTLSDEYGSINPHDISIHEVENAKPQLIIQRHRYTDKVIRDLLTVHSTDGEDFVGEWTTYTFQVPTKSVNKSFGY